MESGAETVTLGRAKRSTAGNRMRELLDQAHAQDQDATFTDEVDDDEFEAPADVRDVYLDEFADTDDEVSDEDTVEREERREAKAEAKARKSKGTHSLLQPQVRRPAKPDLARLKDLHLLDPSLDPSTMAPSALLLAVRRARREAKRADERDHKVRSTLRASTLRTEEAVLAKEAEERAQPSRLGRRAQHETGEVRGLRPMTQAELIARALEEEERNREGLREWVRREEERRELRRVGRKRVKGDRWTWVSRTVGRVEVVEDAAEGEGERARSTSAKGGEAVGGQVIGEDQEAAGTRGTLAGDQQEAATAQASAHRPHAELGHVNGASIATALGQPTAASPPPANETGVVDVGEDVATGAALPTTALDQPDLTPNHQASEPLPVAVGEPPLAPAPTSPPNASAGPSTAAPTGPYMRNYLLLSTLPMPTTLSLILGNHADWTHVSYVTARQRPLHRRPPLCPVTGRPARYKDPLTGVAYADKRAFGIAREVLLGRRAERAGRDAGDGATQPEGEHAMWGWDEAGWLVEPAGVWADGAADVFAPPPAAGATGEGGVQSVKDEAGEDAADGDAELVAEAADPGDGASTPVKRAGKRKSDAAAPARKRRR